MKKMLFALLVALPLFSYGVYQGGEYSGNCRYEDTNEKVVFNGKCNISYDIVRDMQFELHRKSLDYTLSTPMGYIVSFGKNSNATIIIFDNNVATFNGQPARVVKEDKNNITIQSWKYETFTFPKTY